MNGFIPPDIHWMVIVIACCFMVLDFATGFIAAIVNKCVDSQVMKLGLFHKCGFMLAIVFGCLCEYSMYYIDLGFTVPIQDVVCVYIIVTEIVSVLENLAKISPELANAKFMNIFARDKEV